MWKVLSGQLTKCEHTKLFTSKISKDSIYSSSSCFSFLGFSSFSNNYIEISYLFLRINSNNLIVLELLLLDDAKIQYPVG